MTENRFEMLGVTVLLTGWGLEMFRSGSPSIFFSRKKAALSSLPRLGVSPSGRWSLGEMGGNMGDLGECTCSQSCNLSLMAWTMLTFEPDTLSEA